jgi:large subunit ribosomal protein L24
MSNNQNQSKKIRKGDRVLAIAGNHKGSSGTVLAVQGDKVVVQGLNMKSRTLKKSQDNPNGRILKIERPIHVSNLAVCLEDNVRIKLKTRHTKGADRELVYEKEGEKIVYRSVKKPK